MKTIETHIQTQLNGSVVVFCSGILGEVGTTTAKILEKHGANVINQTTHHDQQDPILGNEGSGNVKILAVAKGHESIILPEGISPNAILWMVLNNKNYKNERPNLTPIQQGSLNINDSSPNEIALKVANLLELSEYRLPQLGWLEGYHITPGRITDLMEGKRWQIFTIEKREVRFHDTDVISCNLYLTKDGKIFHADKDGGLKALQNDEDIVRASTYEADDSDHFEMVEIPLKVLKIS